jgi:hypothetical protein
LDSIEQLDNLLIRLRACIYDGKALTVGSADVTALAEVLDAHKAEHGPWPERERCPYIDPELNLQCCIEANHGPKPITIMYGNEIVKDGHQFIPEKPRSFIHSG